MSDGAPRVTRAIEDSLHKLPRFASRHALPRRLARAPRDRWRGQHQHGCPVGAEEVTSYWRHPTHRRPVVPTGLAPPWQRRRLAEAAQLATDLSITALRLGTCVLMVHHGIDKLEHVDGFTANAVAKFFGFLPGEPFDVLRGGDADGAGLLGILSRPTAAAMSGTMTRPSPSTS